VTAKKGQKTRSRKEQGEQPRNVEQVVAEKVEKPAERPREKVEVSVDDENMLEIVKKVGVSAGDVARYVEKAKRFLSLPEEDRRRRVIAFIEYVATMFKEDTAVSAGKNVLRLLAEVPEAMIYFAYMWKPRFRADAMSLLYHLAEAVRRMEQ